MDFPAVCATDDGSSVGFEWWNGARTVWFDWNHDGSVTVYLNDGSQPTTTARFQPGQGHEMAECLTTAFAKISN